MSTVIHPFGDAALLVEMGGPDRAQALAGSLRREPLGGVIESVPGLDSLLVELDPLTDPSRVAADLRARLQRLGSAVAGDARSRTIPVVYGGEHGPDLPEVARLCGSSPDEVVELHAATELRVLFDGFAPGFAYLGLLPPELRVARLATPRTRTPAGAVAITGEMSGIYPAELPGGWQVIGRTPLVLFDPRRSPPAYLVPGDRVRFEPVPARDWERHAGSAADW